MPSTSRGCARNCWKIAHMLDRRGRELLLAWGSALAAMNCCFYLAISRLPLSTVAAIEFLPVIALAALGARSARNALALALAVAGVYLLTDVRLAGDVVGFVFAFANAALFLLYIVLADKVAKRPQPRGVDGLAAATLVAAVVVTPIGGWQAARAFTDPTALLAGIGIGLARLRDPLRPRPGPAGPPPAAPPTRPWPPSDQPSRRSSPSSSSPKSPARSRSPASPSSSQASPCTTQPTHQTARRR